MSIMECLSLGIPVVATDVGGSAEIVDDTVGKVLHPDFSPTELSDFLTKYYQRSDKEKDSVRKAANNRYEERCNSEILTRGFAKLMLSKNI